MRLAKISTIEAANTWLPQYLDKHNALFEHPAADATDAHRTVQGDAQDLRRVCAHHYQRVLSKTLTCKFKRQLLVLITRPEQPRYALRAQTVQVIEHQGGDIELLWCAEAFPFKSFDAHQHLNQTRVADDKLLNARVDEVLVKEASRLRKLEASVAVYNQGTSPRSRLSA